MQKRKRDKDSRNDSRRDDKRFVPRRRKRKCVFCADKIGADYKNISFIQKFVTDRGKIAPRRMTGCCAKHQRLIMREIKKARQVGFVPYVVD